MSEEKNEFESKNLRGWSIMHPAGVEVYRNEGEKTECVAEFVERVCRKRARLTSWADLLHEGYTLKAVNMKTNSKQDDVVYQGRVRITRDRTGHAVEADGDVKDLITAIYLSTPFYEMKIKEIVQHEQQRSDKELEVYLSLLESIQRKRREQTSLLKSCVYALSVMVGIMSLYILFFT